MNITLDAKDLEPLVKQVVEATLEAVESDRAWVGDRLAYSKPKAARLLGVAAHCLREERLKGRVSASVVGRRVMDTRADLLAFLARRRWEAKSK